MAFRQVILNTYEKELLCRNLVDKEIKLRLSSPEEQTFSYGMFPKLARSPYRNESNNNFLIDSKD